MIILNFRGINDDALDFNDRVIFSLLWKWAWQNQRREKQKQKPVAISKRKIRRMTAYDFASITQSLARLKQLGYIDGYQPTTDHPNIMRKYWKVELLPFRDRNKSHRYLDGINREIFFHISETEKKRHTARWWSKVFGVSRSTYFKWKKAYFGFGGSPDWRSWVKLYSIASHLTPEQVIEAVEDQAAADFDQRLQAMKDAGWSRSK